MEKAESSVSESIYDGGDWNYEYGEYKYDNQSEYANDGIETSDEAESATEETEPAVSEPAYDYSEWEYRYACPEERYGYPGCLNADADADDATDETASEDTGYSDAYPEEEYAYPENGLEETDAKEFSYYDEPTSDDEIDYNDADESTSGWQEDASSDWEEDVEGRLEGEPGDPVGASNVDEPYSYNYADPYERYGYDYYGKTADARAEYDEQGDRSMATEEDAAWVADATTGSEPDTSESGLELFAWRPGELLLSPDQEILKTLETLCEEPSGVRRSTLNDYLEALGWEAISFASRFEDVTGIEVLSLADDLPGAAAFLGAFRLLERGELGMDEAVDLLRRSLQNLTLEWIQGVNEITANAYTTWEPADSGLETPDAADSASAGPVMDVMVSLATRSLAGLGGAISNVSRSFAEIDWSSVVAAVESQAASPIGADEGFFQR
jgi:hypothetical protein